MSIEEYLDLFIQVVNEYNSLVIIANASKNRHELAREVAKQHCASLNLDEERLARYLEAYQRSNFSDQKILLDALSSDYNKQSGATP